MPISGQGASSSITKYSNKPPLLNHPRVIAGDASAVSTSSILAMQASNKDISANKYDGVATTGKRSECQQLLQRVLKWKY